MGEKWIQKAIKHPGALTMRAKAAGMTLAQYMAAPHRSLAIKRQVNLAKTLQRLARR